VQAATTAMQGMQLRRHPPPRRRHGPVPRGRFLLWSKQRMTAKIRQLISKYTKRSPEGSYVSVVCITIARGVKQGALVDIRSMA
jgi:hypothetical protein